MPRIMRVLPTMLAVAAMSAPGIAAAESEEPVRVRDFSILPMGNLTNDTGTLRLHPKAMVSAGYDSNVYAAKTEEKSDAYGRALLGIEARYRASEATTAHLDAQFHADKYAEEEERDMVGGTADLGVAWKGDRATAGVDARYARFDDPLVQTGRRIQRENINASVNGGWQAEEFAARLAVGMRSVQYLENEGGFDKDQRSWTGGTADLRVSLLGGEDTRTWLSVKWSSWDYEKNTRFNDGQQISPTLGWATSVGERSKLVLEAGVDFRQYDKRSTIGADDKEVLVPVGSATFVWPYSDQGEVSAKLYATADNSLTSNAYHLYGGQLAVRHAVTEQATVFASVDVSMLEDTAAGTGQKKNSRDTTIGSLGAEYIAVRGLAFRLTGRQTSSTAEPKTGDFDRTEVVFDTVFAF